MVPMFEEVWKNGVVQEWVVSVLHFCISLFLYEKIETLEKNIGL